MLKSLKVAWDGMGCKLIAQVMVGVLLGLIVFCVGVRFMNDRYWADHKDKPAQVGQ
jgi:hypothetical protein